MNPNELNLQLCEILGIPKDAARATITIEPDSLPVVLIERHLIEVDQVQHVEQRFILTPIPEPKATISLDLDVNVPWYAKAYVRVMAHLAAIGLPINIDRVGKRVAKWTRVSVATPGGGSKV